MPFNTLAKSSHVLATRNCVSWEKGETARKNSSPTRRCCGGCSYATLGRAFSTQYGQEWQFRAWNDNQRNTVRYLAE